MGKQKEEIKDPLKLLLPEVIYDYFELVHTELSDKEVHLFLDERHMPPKASGAMKVKVLPSRASSRIFRSEASRSICIFVVENGSKRIRVK